MSMFDFNNNPSMGSFDFTDPNASPYGSLAFLDKAKTENTLGNNTSIDNSFGGSFNLPTADTNFSALAQAPSSNSWWDNMVGTKDSPGWGGMAVGAAQAGANFYLGNKQLGIAEDQLETSKSQFDQQFAAQKQQVNSDIQIQGENRYAYNNKNETPDVYFEKNKIV